MTSDIQDFQWVDPEYLEPNPFNPNVMAESKYEAMKEDMQRDPKVFFINNMIRVTPKCEYHEDPDQPHDRFIIIDGFHKWRAGSELGLDKVPILIRALNKAQTRRECFRINRQRGEIDPVREGAMYKLDTEEGFSQEDIARDYGVSQSQVSQSIALTRLPEKILQLYRTPEATYGELRKKEWEEMIQEVVNEGVLQAIDSHIQATSETPSDKMVADMEEAIRDEARSWPRYALPSLEPRRKLTRSHLELMIALPTEELQIHVALRVMEGQSVRETEAMAKNLTREYDRDQLLAKARELAVLKNCPYCAHTRAPIVRAKEVDGEILVSCGEYDYGAHWWPVTMTEEDARALKKEEKKKGPRERREPTAKLWFKSSLETGEVDEALGLYALQLARGFESASYVLVQGELYGRPATLTFEGHRANRIFRIEYAPEIEEPDYEDLLGFTFGYENEHFKPVLVGADAWPRDKLLFSYKPGGWKTGPFKTRVEVGYQHTDHADKLLEKLEIFIMDLVEGKVGPIPSMTVGGSPELAREFVEFYEKKKEKEK